MSNRKAVAGLCFRAALLATMLLVALAPAAMAADPWRPRLFALEDKTASRGFAEVRAASRSFTPLDGPALRAGLSKSAWWLRFEIPVARQNRQALIVEMGSPIVDRIDLYAVDAQGAVIRYRSGDSVPFADRPMANRLLLFPLPRETAGPITVFARVQSQSHLTVPVKVWQRRAFEENWSWLQAFVGLFFGVVGFALLYNFFVFLSLRDASYGWYVAYLASVVLVHIALLGLGAQFLWPSDARPSNIAPLVTFGLVVIAGAQYFHAFLALRTEQPKLAVVFRVIQAAAVATLVLAAVTSLRLGAQLMSVVGLAVLTVQSIAIVRANLLGFRPARFLIPPLFTLIPAYVVSILAFAGVLPFVFLTENAMRIAAMFESIILSLALADRFNTFRRQREDAERALSDQRRLFTTRLVATQEAERRRIAADLHDSVGQNLLVLGNRLKALSRSPNDQSGNGHAGPLGELSDYARQTLDDVRSISHDLHPSQLDRLGLGPALHSMVHDAMKAVDHQWRCEIDLKDDLLSPAAGIHLYRAMQSALSNSIRHSGATEIRVGAHAQDGEIVATVSDNGVGFDTEADPTGLGLTAMRERMAVVGGRMDVQQQPPAGGTTIRFSVPIEEVP